MKACLKKANYFIDHKPYIFKKEYHIIGRTLIGGVIKQLRKTGWDYLHIPSNCLEQDSHGKRYSNARLLSHGDYDINCNKKNYLVPIYNTAPGFPNWFKSMSSETILKSNFLISKLFRYSLNYNLNHNSYFDSIIQLQY